MVVLVEAPTVRKINATEVMFSGASVVMFVDASEADVVAGP